MSRFRIPGPYGLRPDRDVRVPLGVAPASPRALDRRASAGTTKLTGYSPIETFTAGAIGNAVKDLQHRLNTCLIPSPELREDGVFGRRTRAALLDYQRSAGVWVDGVVGPQTWKLLLGRTIVYVRRQRWQSVSEQPETSTPKKRPLPATPAAKKPVTAPAVPKPQASAPPKQAAADPLTSCCVSSLRISCGHKSRKFALNLPGAKPGPKGRPLIQVLADDKGPDSVSVELQGGPCAKGKPTGVGAGTVLTGAGDAGSKVPSVSLNGSSFAMTGLPPYRVNLSGPKPTLTSDIVDFMRNVFWPDPARLSRSYSGALNCCDGGNSYSFDVEAFTNLEWSGNIALGYELGSSSEVVEYSNALTKKDDEPLLTKRARIYTATDEGKFTAKVAVSGQHGTEKFALESPTFEKKGLASQGPGAGAFPAFKELFEKMIPRMHRFLSNELVNISPQWPKVEIGGQFRLVESETSPSVLPEGQVYLDLNPLIGLQGSTDLLDWLILAAGSLYGSPEVGRLLLKIKTTAAKGVGAGSAAISAKVAVEFSAEGRVGGRLDWSWHAESKAAKGQINAKLAMKLKGECESKVRFLLVSASGGASISGESEISGTLSAAIVDGDPAYAGKLGYSGLTIRSIVFFAVGGSAIGRQAPTEPRDMMTGKWKADASSGQARMENELFSPLELLEPWEWPRQADGSGGRLVAVADAT